VIVARQFSISFTAYITEFSKQTKFPIVLVSNEKFTNDEFGDIASFCGANLIDTQPRTGKQIITMTVKDTGSIKKFIARDKITQFIGGSGLDIKDIKNEKIQTRVSERVDEIKEAQKSEKDKKEIKKMDKRISALLGGVTTIYVGAKTIVDKYYMKLKTENAVNSCIKALEGGMLQGGGLAFKEVADELGESSKLYKTLQAPYERIQQNNMGKEFDLENVFDSFLSMKASLENAVSTIGILLTVEGIIADYEPSMVEELSKVVNKE